MGLFSKSEKRIDAKPVIVYWALHGRSNFAQALLLAGNVDYEVDTNTANNWGDHKADSPFGQLPVMKHGDLTIAQGGAINRYCAKLAGLYPTGAQAAAICDMYIEECMDIYNAIFKPKNAADPAAKKAAWKVVESEVLPLHFGMLEKNLVKSKSAFLGGELPNAADVTFWAVCHLYTKAGLNLEPILEANPTLNKAFQETGKMGKLSSFPDSYGLYFTSDPNHASF